MSAEAFFKLFSAILFCFVDLCRMVSNRSKRKGVSTHNGGIHAAFHQRFLQGTNCFTRYPYGCRVPTSSQPM
ncbi:uncharacterized protein FA14DRAFT_32658 [Meira miltonrushii]|uniref:Secreted protein n=1 Tax=Meira miltonrushii TaxID=1280837 RepID=A0A316VB16_9BASI|nr:uncharacterized protein FA14DRAFT_32658 [Meira miltonrushii]PWN34660.1 hypothetical protein FA14DRAFT_32658 [Meira miltonrushii]